MLHINGLVVSDNLYLVDEHHVTPENRPFLAPGQYLKKYGRGL